MSLVDMNCDDPSLPPISNFINQASINDGTINTLISSVEIDNDGAVYTISTLYGGSYGNSSHLLIFKSFEDSTEELELDVIGEMVTVYGSVIGPNPSNSSKNLLYVVGRMYSHELLIKSFSTDGNTKWSKSYDANSLFFNVINNTTQSFNTSYYKLTGEDIVINSDHHLLIIGYLENKNSGDTRTFLCKIDNTGGIIWSKQYPSYARGYSIALGMSNIVYIAGAKNENQGFLMMIDAITGIVLEAKDFGAEVGITLATSVAYVNTSYGGVLYIVGSTNIDLNRQSQGSQPTVEDGERLWISRLDDSTLSSMWREIKMYGNLGNVATWASSVGIREDGSAIIIGGTESYHDQNIIL